MSCYVCGEGAGHDDEGALLDIVCGCPAKKAHATCLVGARGDAPDDSRLWEHCEKCGARYEQLIQSSMFKHRRQNLLCCVQHHRNYAIEREKSPDAEFTSSFKSASVHLRLRFPMTPYIKSTCQLCLLYLHDNDSGSAENFVKVVGADFLEATHLFLLNIFSKDAFDKEVFDAFMAFYRGQNLYEDDFLLAVCEQLAYKTLSWELATAFLPSMTKEFPHRSLEYLYTEVIRHWRKTGESMQLLQKFSTACLAKGFFSNIVYELVLAYINDDDEDALKNMWAVMSKVTTLDYFVRPDTKHFWENRELLIVKLVTLYALSRTLAKSPDAEGFGFLIAAYKELGGKVTGHSLRFVALQIALYYESIGAYEAAFETCLRQCGVTTTLKGRFIGLARLCYKLYLDKMLQVWKSGGEYWLLAEQVTKDFEREMNRMSHTDAFHDTVFIDEIRIPMLILYLDIVVEPMMRMCLEDHFTPENRTMIPLIDRCLDMCRRSIVLFKVGEFKDRVDAKIERLTVVREACERRLRGLEREKWDAVKGDFWQVAETLTDFFEAEVLAEGDMVPLMKGLYQTRVLDRLHAEGQTERARALCRRVREFSEDPKFCAIVDRTLKRL